MSFVETEWIRFQVGGVPIYIRPDPPCWFIPNDPGDRILLEWRRSGTVPSDPQARRFIDRLPDAQSSSYSGREQILRLSTLQELWIHITNRCNLACRHCLFGSSLNDGLELSGRQILERVRQAHELGCRLFALTVGEPFIHPDFSEILRAILELPETHVVILTNGLQLRPWVRKPFWNPERIHLQVSLDGIKESHDAIRGKGTFDRVCRELQWLKHHGIPFAVSVCPTRRNLKDIPRLVDLAGELEASHMHFMWYFVRGRGKKDDAVDVSDLYAVVTDAVERAERFGVVVDNIQSLASRIFTPPGTRHDGSSMAWESLAVGPDGHVYPSPALVGIEDLRSSWNGRLEDVWKQSPVLKKIRAVSVASLNHPLRFFLGGGDPDHSFVHGGRLLGGDPYLELHEKLALWLLARRVPPAQSTSRPMLRLKMGDILESCRTQEGVGLVHSNCFLMPASQSPSAHVRDFYAAAASQRREDIVNPVEYPEELLAHVPREFRFRGYGCGSPVADASIREGETVVDLGCGSGVECYVAARLTGPQGRVVGIDMLPPVLKRAQEGAVGVCRNLGYRNLFFGSAVLESLPLKSNSADVVVSNCVLNLSPDKRRAFSEIFRILRPGGRLVVADVVCDTEPGASIRNDPELQGECIAGALTQKDLVGLLEEVGFVGVRLHKRFLYRVVSGHPFYSLTFEARKALETEEIPVIYTGPFAAVETSGGQLLRTGPIYAVPKWEAETFGSSLFILDKAGNVRNQKESSPCGCVVDPAPVPPASGKKVQVSRGTKISLRRRSGCMVCGSPLVYKHQDVEVTCVYCGRKRYSNAMCEKGHHVCDACHSEDALTITEHVLLMSAETDMLALLDKVRRHPAFPVHGPEHHALVPGIIVTAWRNMGGEADESDIRSAIRRGSQIPGGACGFMGCCGAALGVGIGFSVLLQANPVRAKLRQRVQQVTQVVLKEISKYEAARCCQRDAWLALRKAAELSHTLLDRPLKADYVLKCRQQAQNAECLGRECPVLESLSRKKPVDMSAGVDPAETSCGAVLDGLSIRGLKFQKDLEIPSRIVSLRSTTGGPS